MTERKGRGNRTDLEKLGRKLIMAARTELYLSMRFMGPALMSLEPVMDLSVRTAGTDAAALRYNPIWLMQTYLEHPYILNRTYLHTIIHCLFRHMYGTDTHTDEELWNLCADIAAESVIDTMDYAVVRRTPSEFREEWYGILERDVGVLTAERLYRYFSARGSDYNEITALSAEFFADDHVFWDRLKDEPSDEKSPGSRRLPDRDEEWKKTARRVESELTLSGNSIGNRAGGLLRQLSFDLREVVRYRDLLRKFSILREECRVDPESFDYGFYHYGMELYGNMPLIEENEFAEAKRVRSLVIAIDTSASVSDETVKRFLEETAGILLRKENFFSKFELHILECDAELRGDILITKPEEMERYAAGISLSGGGGTDFRPVFEYVKEQKKKGKLRDLSGLVYFTDGFGRYPKEAPEYDTAFVFSRDDLAEENEIPPWILRVYLDDAGPDAVRNAGKHDDRRYGDRVIP